MEPGAPGHVVVCGFGHLGQSVVQLLSRLGERVVVISDQTRRATGVRLDDPNVRFIRGDARDASVLEKADLTGARAVIAATDHDLTNVEIALDVRRANADTPVVVRLFDQNLARMLEQSFDVRRAFAMSALAAPIFASAALDDPLLARFDFGDDAFVIAETSDLAKSNGSTLAAHGLTLAPETAWKTLLGEPEATPIKSATNLAAALRWPAAVWRHAPLSMRITFMLLVGLTMISVFVFSAGMQLGLVDAFYFMITTITTTGYGDITPKDSATVIKLYTCFVMLLGSATTALFYSFFTDFIVAERFRRVAQNPDVTLEGHVVVIGLGNVGYRIVENLRRFGVPVVGVDVDAAAPFASELRSQLPVLAGDGRLSGTLDRAGVARARALIAATGNDATNLEIALAAKHKARNVRVVSRLFDPAFATKVQGVLPIERALSASRVASPSFVAAALFTDVVAAFVRNSTFVVVTREAAPATWAGRTAADLQRAEGVALVLQSGDGAHTPVDAEARVVAGARYVLVRQRPLG